MSAFSTRTRITRVGRSTDGNERDSVLARHRSAVQLRKQQPQPPPPIEKPKSLPRLHKVHSDHLEHLERLNGEIEELEELLRIAEQRPSLKEYESVMDANSTLYDENQALRQQKSSLEELLSNTRHSLASFTKLFSVSRQEAEQYKQLYLSAKETPSGPDVENLTVEELVGNPVFMQLTSAYEAEQKKVAQKQKQIDFLKDELTSTRSMNSAVKAKIGRMTTTLQSFVDRNAELQTDTQTARSDAELYKDYLKLEKELAHEKGTSEYWRLSHQSLSQKYDELEELCETNIKNYDKLYSRFCDLQKEIRSEMAKRVLSGGHSDRMLGPSLQVPSLSATNSMNDDGEHPNRPNSRRRRSQSSTSSKPSPFRQYSEGHEEATSPRSIREDTPPSPRSVIQSFAALRPHNRNVTSESLDSWDLSSIHSGVGSLLMNANRRELAVAASRAMRPTSKASMSSFVFDRHKRSSSMRSISSMGMRDVVIGDEHLNHLRSIPLTPYVEEDEYNLDFGSCQDLFLMTRTNSGPAVVPESELPFLHEFEITSQEMEEFDKSARIRDGLLKKHDQNQHRRSPSATNEYVTPNLDDILEGESFNKQIFDAWDILRTDVLDDDTSFMSNGSFADYE